MKSANYLILLLSLALFMSSCESDNAEESFPMGPCDDVRDISYRTDLVPLIQTHCLQCHSMEQRFGGLELESFTSVQNIALRGDNALANSLRGIAPLRLMPPSGMIDECDIRRFEDWIADGAPNN